MKCWFVESWLGCWCCKWWEVDSRNVPGLQTTVARVFSGQDLLVRITLAAVVEEAALVSQETLDSLVKRNSQVSVWKKPLKSRMPVVSCLWFLLWFWFRIVKLFDRLLNGSF